MCKLKSGIILEDRIFIGRGDSHSDMLRELGIADTRENAESIFVRAELYPNNGDVFTNPETWIFDVEQDILPGWYVSEYDKTRVGDLLPDLRIATFRCSACGFSLQVNRDGHRISEPERCPNCHVANTLQVDHNGGLFADKQLIKMQEIPDHVPQGETPQSVSLYAYDDLFDSVKPGDKVDVTGIFRAVPVRVNRKQSTIRDVFRTYIDVLHFRHVSHGVTRSDANRERMGGK